MTSTKAAFAALGEARAVLANFDRKFCARVNFTDGFALELEATLAFRVDDRFALLLLQIHD